MPWVKGFDEEAAVDRATAVFWAKGFEATSMSDLIDAMQINKGSLYNAFGSKHDLFLRVLLRYDAAHNKVWLAQLDAMERPLDAVAAFFDGLIDESCTDLARKGCLLVNTALDLPNHAPEIQNLVTRSLKEMEAFFRRTIRRAKERGELPAALDANQTGKWLLAQAVGMRVLSRGVFERSALRAVRTQVLRQLAA